MADRRTKYAPKSKGGEQGHSDASWWRPHRRATKLIGGQGQKGGDNANQVQIAGDVIIHQGVTEDRAREIARETAVEAIERYSEEAQGVATARIEQFDASMIQRLARENLLGAMADPAFQVTLRKAQMGAASTEREDDYEILSALIEDRAKRADERPVRASVNRAVEIVDQMDTGGLRGLTCFAAVTTYTPRAGQLEQGLDVIEALLSQLIEGEGLPRGREWVEHLDVLGAVRLSAIEKFMPFQDYLAGTTPGYVSMGVAADSPEFAPVLKELSERHVNLQLLPHALKPGFLRVPFPNRRTLSDVLTDLGRSAADVEEVLEMLDSGLAFSTRDDALMPAYFERVKARPTLNAIAEWWAAFPEHFRITPVGNIVARANARRLDKDGVLPPIG